MSQQTEQGAPPYSEDQVRRWLAFLARGMTEHDQTVFLIEKLQPSWLSKRWRQWVYLLASRLIWSILSGLVIGMLWGLLSGLIGGDWMIDRKWLIILLSGDLIGGLAGGLIDVIWTSFRPIQVEHIPVLLLSKVFPCLLIIGLIVGLIHGLVAGLMFGSVFGLVFGSVWIWRGQARTRRNEIETIETVRFLWDGFLNGYKIGFLGGLIVGLILGLTFILSFGLISVLTVGLVFGLGFGLFLGLSNCFQPSIRELKTSPNQGILLSLRSARLMGGMGGVALGIIIGLISRDLVTGLAYGALGGLSIGLWYGGLDVIQHFLVRFLLWRAGSLPWRLALFLDYAAEELHFLQKVGGGYIFVHRYLLEHFAAMETDDGRPQTADGEPRVSDAG